MIQVSWVRLSRKMGVSQVQHKTVRILGQKCSSLAPNQFFSEMVQIFFCYHDWTIANMFCVDPVARQASGRLLGPIFCPKFCIIFTLHLGNLQFFGFNGPDSMRSSYIYETSPKALRTQALTALTSNFGLVGLVQKAWQAIFDLFWQVWSVWVGRFGLVW